MIIDKNFSLIMEKAMNLKAFSVDETRALVRSIMENTVTEVRIGAILTAFRFTHFSEEHILAIVDEIKQKARVLDFNSTKKIVDYGSTGGNDYHSLNVGTVCSIVAASLGAVVTKFSGRDVSGKIGSGEVLKMLNIPPVRKIEDIDFFFNKVNIAYMPATFFYPILKELSDMRKTLGFKTMIDFVFPLAIPLNLYGQIIGAYRRDLLPLLINCMKSLGRSRALAIYGADGSDEISICGETFVSKLENGKITNEVWRPEDFGFNSFDLKQFKYARSVEKNSHIILDVVHGRANEAIEAAVLINSAALLWCAEKCDSIVDGIKLAKKSIVSGMSLKTLQDWSKI